MTQDFYVMDNSVSKFEDDAPSTIKEVGIHMAYMRQDIAKLTTLVEQLPNGFATKEELLAVDSRVTVLESAHGSFWVQFGKPALQYLFGAISLFLVLSFLNKIS